MYMVDINNHLSTLELAPRWDKILFCTRLYPIGIIFHQLTIESISVAGSGADPGFEKLEGARGIFLAFFY